MHILHLLLLALMTGFALPTQAMDIKANYDRYNLLHQVELFVDETRQVQAEEFIKNPDQFDFQPTGAFASKINFGFQRLSIG